MTTQTVQQILDKEAQGDKNIANAKLKAKDIVSQAEEKAQGEYNNIIHNAKAQAQAIIDTAEKELEDTLAQARVKADENSAITQEKAMSQSSKITDVVKEILFA